MQFFASGFPPKHSKTFERHPQWSIGTLFNILKPIWPSLRFCSIIPQIVHLIGIDLGILMVQIWDLLGLFKSWLMFDIFIMSGFRLRLLPPRFGECCQATAGREVSMSGWGCKSPWSMEPLLVAFDVEASQSKALHTQSCCCAFFKMIVAPHHWAPLLHQVGCRKETQALNHSLVNTWLLEIRKWSLSMYCANQNRARVKVQLLSLDQMCKG